MGSGKSKVAENLGRILGLEVLDTDQLIESLEKRSISEIFNSSGQEYFREKEKEILHATLENENIIVSTGGGLPCFFDNMEWMNTNGLTVYLEANPGLLFHRLSGAKAGRPLIEKLDDVELMEQISRHIAIRTPYYSKAKIVIGAASVNVKSLAEKIQDYLN